MLLNKGGLREEFGVEGSLRFLDVKAMSRSSFNKVNENGVRWDEDFFCRFSVPLDLSTQTF